MFIFNHRMGDQHISSRVFAFVTNARHARVAVERRVAFTARVRVSSQLTKNWWKKCIVSDLTRPFADAAPVYPRSSSRVSKHVARERGLRRRFRRPCFHRGCGDDAFLGGLVRAVCGAGSVVDAVRALASRRRPVLKGGSRERGRLGDKIQRGRGAFLYVPQTRQAGWFLGRRGR